VETGTPVIRVWKCLLALPLITGECLSIYARTDTIANSCQKVFSKIVTGFSNEKIKLENDKGHNLFFQPKDIRFEPVIACLKQRKWSNLL
jgi:hypothetical protein